MNIFISQPMKMNDLANDKIKKRRQKIINDCCNLFPNENINIIDSFMEDAPHDASPVWFLGKSIKFLSTADVVYFALGWEKARGCIVEHKICSLYHIPIVDERISDSFKKNGDTYMDMVVGAPNKIDAMLAAIQQLHTEMHNLQEQMTEKQKAVEILTKYCCDEIGGRNQ